jgi:Astacin (Peptidase family M12A)
VSKHLFLILILSILSCAEVSKNSEEGNKTQSVILFGFEWPGGIAPVCWVNTSFPKTMALVKNHINNAFSEEEGVPLKFTGWEKCNDDVKGRIRIEVNASVPSRPDLDGRMNSWIGNTAMYSGNPTTLYIYSKKKKSGKILQDFDVEELNENSPEISIFLNSVLHEFGHAAGLLHEHWHLKYAVSCLETKTDTDTAQNLSRHISKYFKSAAIKYSSEPDYKSIMNYCHPYYFSPGTTLPLSDGDKKGLNELYGAKDKAK